MPDNYNRPDPDTILQHVQAEEKRQASGKLKIFLGYAAGVGKTYAMLEAAQQRHLEGVDIVTGYVETHGRPETEMLTDGLEVVPRRRITYRDILLEEMDTDAILKRQPTVVLVDELAHTNAPESRHLKRFQDIEELLAAGIDVYTTLNIQHLESVNDIVAQITGVFVREKVPDRVLDLADQIVLTDLPPEELIQRLHEGKVYVPEQATRAIEKFFRQGNLTALRELTLRRAAQHVDEEMSAYMQMRAIPGPWAVGERLLVCVSPSPFSQRLIRSARRLAKELDAEWHAVFVESIAESTLSAQARQQITENLQLAEELGARVVSLPGDDSAETLLRYAHTQNVTKIIVGKPLKPRWIEIFKGSLVDKLIRHSGPIDIYVISSDQSEGGTASHFTVWPTNQGDLQALPSILTLIALTTAFGLSINRFISPTNLVMFYLLAVVIAAVRLGRGPAIITATLSVIAFNFFFVPPRFTFAVDQAEYLLTFAALFTVGLVIATLAARMREHARIARQRHLETMALYALSRDLSASVELKPILQAITRHVGQTFSCDVGIFLPEDKHLSLALATENFPHDKNEEAVAAWVYENSRAAGFGTETLPAAQGRYLPLPVANHCVGVLGVSFNSTEILSSDRKSLLEAFASQAALGIDSQNLAEQARHTRLLHETEKLQTALLNSISHDLRTPLASITGTLSSLRDQENILTDQLRSELLDGAYEEAQHLNLIVGNLLEMSRLESNTMVLRTTPCDLQEIIGASLNNLENRLHGRSIRVDIADNVLFIQADFVLMMQVLINILDNACNYSPPNTSIEIEACLIDMEMVQVTIRDHGNGLSPSDLSQIFEKFYRGTTVSGTTGTGLGLSICRGIVEARGGSISAHNHAEGGLVVQFTVPVSTKD